MPKPSIEERTEKFRKAITKDLGKVVEKHFRVSKLSAKKQSAFNKALSKYINRLSEITAETNNDLLLMRKAKSDEEKYAVGPDQDTRFKTAALFHTRSLQSAGTIGLTKDNQYLKHAAMVVRKNLKEYFPYTFRLYQSHTNYGFRYYIILFEISLTAAKIKGMKIRMHKPPKYKSRL